MFRPFAKETTSARPRPDDTQDVRMASLVQWVDLRKNPKPLDDQLKALRPEHVVLWGYPDDRGVGRNMGRAGAKDAPDQVRRWLYAMTPAEGMGDLTIWDFGNFDCREMNLLAAHNQARAFVKKVRARGCRIVTLGGGHDWGFPDYVDLQNDHPEPAHVVNFDAHLDMRPLPEDENLEGHSGTPFRRILVAEGKPPRVSAVGLQKHCNAPSHLEWSEQYEGVTRLFLEDFPDEFSRQWEHILTGLAISEQELLALSLDLDAFPRSVSPGVSAPQAFGVDPRLALKFMRHFKGRVRQLGLYEINPEVDQDGATARLAAKFIHEFLRIT